MISTFLNNVVKFHRGLREDGRGEAPLSFLSLHFSSSWHFHAHQQLCVPCHPYSGCYHVWHPPRLLVSLLAHQHLSECSPPARYRPSIKCSCGQTSSSSKLTVGSYAAKLEFSESRLGAKDVSVQIQWLGADRWQGWSQRWGKQDLRTGVFGTISIWTITITIFNNIETPAPFGVLPNCKEINLWAQILQNLFMASPFSYLLCQCLASANAEKLSNVQCFRSKADE